jgi:hypothetical protein
MPRAEAQSQTGSGVPVWGRRSEWMRITVPSMIGRVSSCAIQADRCLSQGCRPSQPSASNARASSMLTRAHPDLH